MTDQECEKLTELKDYYTKEAIQVSRKIAETIEDHMDSRDGTGQATGVLIGSISFFTALAKGIGDNQLNLMLDILAERFSVLTNKEMLEEVRETSFDSDYTM